MQLRGGSAAGAKSFADCSERAPAFLLAGCHNRADVRIDLCAPSVIGIRWSLTEDDGPSLDTIVQVLTAQRIPIDRRSIDEAIKSLDVSGERDKIIARVASEAEARLAIEATQAAEREAAASAAAERAQRARERTKDAKGCEKADGERKAAERSMNGSRSASAGSNQVARPRGRTPRWPDEWRREPSTASLARP